MNTDKPTTAPLGELQEKVQSLMMNMAVNCYNGTAEGLPAAAYQARDDVMQLFTAERQRLIAALPKKGDVQYGGTNPWGVAYKSDRDAVQHGFNQAIDAVTALLKGQTEEVT